MERFKILGKIDPPLIKIDLESNPEIKYRFDKSEIFLKSLVSIKQSMVTVSCEVNHWSEEVLTETLPYIYDWVGAVVDLFTFSEGTVWHVHLDRAEYPDGSVHCLINRAPDLAKLATACRVTDDQGCENFQIDDVLKIVITSPTLMFALRDMAASIRYGNNSFANCGRVIEALRNELWGREELKLDERKQAWEKLRNTLHVSKSYLETITEASKPARHGSSAYTPATQRKDVFTRTWTVMNRYLLYRLGGNQPLAEADFRLLQ